MNTQKSLLAAVFFAALSSLSLVAQNVPLAISYQAVLTDDAGAPLSPGTPTNYDLVFRIYDSQEDGMLLWSEGQGVSVLDGSFSTLLGTGSEVLEDGIVSRPQLDAVFGESERYLEITIKNPLKTFTPRQRMVSTPFAFRSLVAESALSVAEGVVSGDQIAAGAVGSSEIAANAVGSSEIDAGAVGSSEIAAGAVRRAKIAANAVGSSEIEANAVGSSEIAPGAVNINELAAAVQNLLVPAGTIVAWAGAQGAIPVGWELCNGSYHRKTDFPDLFNAIGDRYWSLPSGVTDPDKNSSKVKTNWFRVPDYRGYFLRGHSLATGIDPDKGGRVKRVDGASEIHQGSIQMDEFGDHDHVGTSGFSRLMRAGTNTIANGTDTTIGQPDLKNTGAHVAKGGSETRPKNIYVHYIIKAH